MIGMQPERRKEMTVVEVRKQKGRGWKEGLYDVEEWEKIGSNREKP
jgi:hypothetical protein